MQRENDDHHDDNGYNKGEAPASGLPEQGRDGVFPPAFPNEETVVDVVVVLASAALIVIALADFSLVGISRVGIAHPYRGQSRVSRAV